MMGLAFCVCDCAQSSMTLPIDDGGQVTIAWKIRCDNEMLLVENRCAIKINGTVSLFLLSRKLVGKYTIGKPLILGL